MILSSIYTLFLLFDTVRVCPILRHEAPEYINGQRKLNRQHARWVAFLQEFAFTLKHKFGMHNKVADALIRKTSLLYVVSEGCWI